MESAWYCICSHFKHEHIAAAHLRKICGVEVFNPQIRLIRSTRRGPVRATESLFPNYLFARLVLSSMLEKVQYIPAVRMVLRFGGNVPSIPDSVIEDLKEDLDEIKSEVFTDAPGEGEEVEVAAGAFRGLKGPVTRVLPAKQRVEVLLDFMGRSVPAEVSLSSLVFRRKGAASLALPGENWWSYNGWNQRAAASSPELYWQGC